MAATDGLGWMMFSASRFLRNDVIIIGILLLGVLGMALEQASSQARRRDRALAGSGLAAMSTLITPTDDEALPLAARRAPAPSLVATAWHRLGDRRITLLSLGILVLPWVVLTEGGSVNELFLPGPALLWDGLVDLLENGYRSRSIWEHAGLASSECWPASSPARSPGRCLALPWATTAESKRSSTRSSSFCGRCHSSPISSCWWSGSASRRHRKSSCFS